MAQRKPTRAEIEATDYAANMLKEGHNRAERDAKVSYAPDYDRAAHSLSELPSQAQGRRSLSQAHNQDPLDSAIPLKAELTNPQTLKNTFEFSKEVNETDEYLAGQMEDETGLSNPALPLPKDTFHSPAGTDAAGEYDVDGGALGGSPEEIQSLEGPVDKNPRMRY